MKTNRSARRTAKIRVLLVFFIIAGIAGLEFWMGESLAARIGQTTASLTDSPPVPNVSLSDLMAAAH